MSEGLVAARNSARAARCLFLVGTALGCTLGISGAADAQNITYNGPGPYTLIQQTPVSGGPRAIDITVTSGDATVDTSATSVSSTNNGSSAGIGIGVNNTGPGTILVRTGDVTANGSGQNSGIDVRANAGTITISNTGTIDASGNNSDRGIVARSGGGDVIVNSNVANGQQYGIIVTGNGGTFGDTGTTTITSTNANANGTGLVNAIVAQGYRVVLDSGTASTSNAGGVQGTAIFANAGAGGVLLNAGTTSALGLNQAGIQVFSDGAVDVTSGAIRATQNSDGLSIQSGTDLVIRSTSIDAGGRGLVLGGNSGGGGFNGGPNGFAFNSATVTSGSITTTSDSGYGIYVTPNGTGSTAINSGTIATAGAYATGIFVTPIGTGSVGGPLTINSANIATTGNFAYGIQTYQPATASNGTVSVTSTGNLSTSGMNADGIIVTPGNGAATITNTGTIATTGSAAAGILLAGQDGGGTKAIDNRGSVSTGGANAAALLANGGTGAVTITSNAVSTKGDGGHGIQALTTTGAIDITSSNAAVAGQYAYGITAQSTSGAISIHSGTITSASSDSVGYLSAGISATTAGPIAITSGNITTASAFGSGILASQTDGANAAIDVTSTGAISTTGRSATGITASPSAGNVAISNSGSISTAGDYGYGVFVTGGTGPTTIANSGSIATSGANAYGVYLNGTTGTQGVSSTSVATTGLGANGIYLRSTSGALTVNSGTVTTAANDATAIYANASNGGNVSVTAGSTKASGQQTNSFAYGIIANSAGAGTTGTVTVNSVDASAVVNSAIFASGGGAVNVTSGSAASSGQYALQANSRLGDVSVDATTTTLTRSAQGYTQSAALQANATAGNAVVRAGIATAEVGSGILVTAGGNASITATQATGGGDGAAGVNATAGTGLTLNIGAASSNGTAVVDDARTSRADAIFGTATNGAIVANIGSATATGAGADAVRLIADGTGGAVTANITGTLSSTSGNGLFIDPPGAVTVGVAAGATIAGGQNAINTTGGSNAITNFGTISSSGGAAILTAGATSLDNSGAIAGANGLAVQLGASDDSVVLRTGSTVTGTIASGGGNDTASLVGTNASATAAQTVATFDGFSKLNATSGYWTASSAPSSFGSVSVASGSSLELRSVDGSAGLSITAPTIADAGALVVRTATGATSSFGSTQLTGAGLFNVTGAGTLAVATDNSAFSGKTLVSGGTLQLTGTLGAVETAPGGTFMLGNGGTSGNVTGPVIDNGTFVANRSDNYTLAGGLSGNGTFVKQGSGSFTFGGAYTFTGSVDVAAGSLRFSTGLAANSEVDLSGGGKLDLSGQTNTTSELAGSSPNAIIDISGGTLTDNQATNTTFAGDLTGSGGALNKTGPGTLNLTGASTYTGPTSVTGGTLAVNGSIASTVGIANGGKLGGNGTVGGVNAGAGGIVGPGNSIGLLNVAGNIAFGQGSTYQVEANAAGQADRIVATGTATLTGGTVAVLAQPGTYARATGYNILTANGGVTGTFASVTSNLAFLTPLLTYSSNAVQLTLTRNDIAFSTFAGNANQLRAANAVQALGYGNSLYNLVLTQSDAGAQTALSSLATEIHAGVGTAIIEQERDVRDVMLERSRSAGLGAGVWLHGLYDWAHSRGGESLRLGVDRKGVLGGIGGGIGGLRIGALAGYVEGDLDVRSQSASAKDHTKLVGVYAGWGASSLSVRGGANWSWHDIDTSRGIVFPGNGGSATGAYQAQSGQIFGEAAYNLLAGPVRLEPFLGYSHVRSRTDAFAEVGTSGALNVGRDRRDADFATLGLRFGGALPIGPRATLRPRVSAAWQRGWGDLEGTTTASFGPNAGTFVLTGAGVGRNTLVVDAGLDAELGHGLTIGASADAGVSARWSSTGLRATLGLRF